ncbi:MAG: hypothetical protein HGA97_11670 [Chlorobiaceae bacterium]|nr:hypothetical protein [Chlorobiaceae bacterium]
MSKNNSRGTYLCICTANKNPKATFQELDADGVMFKSFKSLIAFIEQTEDILRATQSLAIAKVKDQQKIESLMKGLFGK